MADSRAHGIGWVPITYAVDGRQYLAVASGAGWFVAWPNVLDVFPDVHQPIGDPVIQVFALPE